MFGRKNSLIICVGLAISFGILFGSITASRSQALFGSNLFTPASRLICVALAVFCAAALKGHRLSQRIIFTIVEFSLAMQLFVIFVTRFFSQSEYFALGVVSAFFEGAALCFLTYWLLSYARNNATRFIAGVIASGFLIASIYDFCFIGQPPETIIAQWVFAKMGVIALLTVVFVLPRFKGKSGDAGIPLQPTTASQSKVPDTPWTKACLPFCAVAATLFLIQGLFSNITGLGGVGSNSFFDHSVGIYVIGARAAILLLCLSGSAKLKPTSIAAVCAVVWATGLLLVSASSDETAYFIGALTLEVGMYALQVLCFVVAVQYAQENEEQANQIIFSMVGIVFCTNVTRVLSSLALPVAMPETDPTSKMALVCLWLVVCIVVAHYHAVYRIGRSFSEAPLLDTASSLIGQSDMAKRELRFGRRFHQMCKEKNLTDRERDVLFEAVHGYTIDHIAEKLCLSSETVKTYLSRAYTRIGTNGKQGVLKLIESRDSMRE
ncbi:LuxR C-terminal-related transcriptional regulator [Raoultibacter timonensis]|uniref:LuxR C-terminal-related transcriptional regulator n=1 Tax=Raoultibacter timonensis TaxID=1907662 RepID=UPI0026DD29A3|nr:LuxR C-terminal-related transcriptional regulator [Raoultibacter timonensis]